MAKLLWCIILLVSLALAQIENHSLSSGTSSLSKFYSADTTKRIIIESSDIPNIDVLQESLYNRIIDEIDNPKQELFNSGPKNKLQLLRHSQKYYPKATLNNNTIIIPYPQRIVKEFKEIRYGIPSNYLNNKDKTYSLEPVIRLDLNPTKSTLMINKSYLLSYYRSPKIKKNSVHQCSKALQFVYNLILPLSSKNKPTIKQNVFPNISYKGYKSHEIILRSAGEFSAFWASLHRQGSLYFFPSKIDELEEYITIFGLLYVIKDEILDIHHFGEMTVSISKTYQETITEFKLIFYPFIKNNETIK
jgi:hypothetical protein